MQTQVEWNSPETHSRLGSGHIKSKSTFQV